MNRREFLSALAALPFAADVLPFAADAASMPVIDSHIHLFDDNRAEGSPYPGRDSQLGQSALPSRYRKVVRPFGVVGAIVVEAQIQFPRIEDNQWVLDQAEKDPIIVGTVGRLDPESPFFGSYVERFRQNKLFLGIRQSRLTPALDNPKFVSNLKLLADAGLSVDAIPTNEDNAAEVFVRVTDKVPSLRLIINHYANAKVPEDRAKRDAYMVSLRELGQRPQVYSKLSEVVKIVDGRVSTDLRLYKDWLDQLWDVFGEDHTLFGSDWPESESLEVNSYPNVFKVAHTYVQGKGPGAMEKVFWKNSIPAYHWIERTPSQQALVRQLH